MKLISLLTALGVLSAALDAESAILTVNSIADNLTSDNFLTLREAVVMIDNGGVTNTAASINRPLTAAEQTQISGAYGVNDKIILPVGTIQLTIVGTGEGLTPALPKIGDLDITVSGVTVQGAGAASTVIQQTSPQDRVFDVNVNFDANFVFTVDGVTISGGRETSAVAGGGMFSGSSSAGSSLTTVKHCKFINNQASGSGTLGGGGLAHTGGNLVVSNCVFGGTGVTDKNTSSASGGALYFDAFGTVATLTVTNCTFTNNTAGSLAAGGGAIDVAAVNLGVGTYNIGGCTFSGNQAPAASGGGITVETGTLNVTACNFLSNSAAVNGGAIYSAGQPVTVRYCRLLGNTVTAPSNGKVFRANGGTFNANENWWGVNSGPAVNDVVGLSVTTWLQLRHAASPNTIFVPNATTLTATFLTNSAGTFIPVANLGRLVGLPITFNNAVRGTLSGAQATIQSSGTATATFTANAAGAGSADAVVDNQTTTAAITIPTGVSSMNLVQATPTKLSSVQWTVTFTNAVSGVVAANFSLVNGGLGGSPGITSVMAVGGAPASSWIVTAGTGSGTGTLGLNMVNGTGVSAVIVNLPFTGQVYAIDLVPPDTSITTQPPSITNSAPASFSFTGSDTGAGVAGFQCRLDGAAYTNCTSPVNFTGLPDGPHAFNVRAVDGAGNVDASPGAVTWTVDTTPPTITCPTNVTVSANSGTCSATNVTLGSPTTFDTGGVASVTNNAPAVYPVGTNTVTWVVRDQVGFTNSCKQLVIVQDTEAPRIFCSTNITVNTAGQCPVVVTFSVAATDNCGLTNLVVTPGTGSSFQVGTNLVNALAQDSAGNSNTCSFTVTVLAGSPPQLTIVRSGNDVVLSWPGAFDCYALQFTPTLPSPPFSNNWTLHPGPFTTAAGGIYATNSIGAANRFFRLAY